MARWDTTQRTSEPPNVISTSLRKALGTAPTPELLWKKIVEVKEDRCSLCGDLPRGAVNNLDGFAFDKTVIPKNEPNEDKYWREWPHLDPRKGMPISREEFEEVRVV